MRPLFFVALALVLVGLTSAQPLHSPAPPGPVRDFIEALVPIDDFGRKRPARPLEPILKRLTRPSDILHALKLSAALRQHSPKDLGTVKKAQTVLIERLGNILKSEDAVDRTALLAIIATQEFDVSAKQEFPLGDGGHWVNEALADLIVGLLDTEKEPRPRIEALRALTKVAPHTKALEAAMKSALTSSDKRERLACVTLWLGALPLTTRGSFRAPTALLPSLNLLGLAVRDDAPEVRVAACEVLATLDDVLSYIREAQSERPDRRDGAPHTGADASRKAYNEIISVLVKTLANPKIGVEEKRATLQAVETAATIRWRLLNEANDPGPKFAKELTAPVEAVPSAIRLLNDDDLLVQLGAVYLLETLGEDARSAALALSKLLASEEKFLRWGAARAIRNLAPVSEESVLKALGTACRDVDRDVRLAALQALGRFGAKAKSALPALVLGVEHKDSRTRLVALDSLAELGKEAASSAPALVKALADTDSRVRIAAATALGRIGRKDPAIRKALAEALDSPDADLKAAAAEALLGDMDPAAKR